MSKRGSESIPRGNPKVKKRNGVKIRTLLIPDSDEESPPLNVDTEYARWVKTRVTTSGQAGRITTGSVPLIEAADVTDNAPLEVNNELAGDTVIGDAVPKTSETRKKQKKAANDSVSLLIHIRSLILLISIQTKMYSWLNVRPDVLDEIISLDGPGDAQTDLCSSCLVHKTTTLYRCLECSYGLLFCRECAIKSHRALPLHRFEVRSFHVFSPSSC